MLAHLVKISGLLQILCNLSINLVYIIYIVLEQAIPSGNIPRSLALNILILLCTIPGYISMQAIDDKPLTIILLLVNLVITGVLFVMYYNVFKNFGPHA